MLIDGKEFIREIKVDGPISLYEVYFCSEYVSATVLWRESERNAKHIGYLTCLNHPSRDGTNPHWNVIIQILRPEIDRMKHTPLKSFVEALKRHTPLTPPVWIELRDCVSHAHDTVGELWNDE